MCKSSYFISHCLQDKWNIKMQTLTRLTQCYTNNKNIRIHKLFFFSFFSFFKYLFPEIAGRKHRHGVGSPVGIWQWFADPIQLLSSSKATGLCVSQPITSPKHSAEHNYRSEYVTTSLSRVRTTPYQFHPAISYVFLSAITSGTEFQSQPYCCFWFLTRSRLQFFW